MRRSKQRHNVSPTEAKLKTDKTREAPTLKDLMAALLCFASLYCFSKGPPHLYPRRIKPDPTVT